LKKLKILPLPLPFCFPLAAAVVFFALPVGPCRPIVGSGIALLDLGFVAAIVGAGTLGGTARVKGVLAGVPGGVGGRPTKGEAAFVSARAVDSRGLRNIASASEP